MYRKTSRKIKLEIKRGGGQETETLLLLVVMLELFHSH